MHVYWSPKESPDNEEVKSLKVYFGGISCHFWASMTWYAYGPLTVLEGSKNTESYIS